MLLKLKVKDPETTVTKHCTRQPGGSKKLCPLNDSDIVKLELYATHLAPIDIHNSHVLDN